MSIRVAQSVDRFYTDYNIDDFLNPGLVLYFHRDYSFPTADSGDSCQ